MSGAKTKAVNEFFLKRLEQPGHALEATGYLSSRLADQSVETIEKMLKVDGIQPDVVNALREARGLRLKKREQE